jgi:hypothetical protein
MHTKLRLQYSNTGQNCRVLPTLIQENNIQMQSTSNCLGQWFLTYRVVTPDG